MFQIWQLAAARPGPFMIRVVAAEFKKKEPVRHAPRPALRLACYAAPGLVISPAGEESAECRQVV
jgi:hypothetical protein